MTINLSDQTMPRDLDRCARRKWTEITARGDLDEIGCALLEHFCRIESRLMEIRKETRAQKKAKRYSLTVKTKSGLDVLHPLFVAEMRLIDRSLRLLIQLRRRSKRQENVSRQSVQATRSSEKKPHFM